MNNTEGRVHFSQDPETGTITFSRDEGGETVTHPMPSIVREIEEMSLTRSERLIQEAKARSGAKIERHIIEGEEWFLGRLDWPGSQRVALLTPRNEKNEIDLTNRDVLTKYTAALLFCATFDNIEGTLPFFSSYERTLVYVELPGATNIVTQLYIKLVEMNGVTAPKKTQAETSSEANGS